MCVPSISPYTEKDVQVDGRMDEDGVLHRYGRWDIVDWPECKEEYNRKYDVNSMALQSVVDLGYFWLVMITA